MVTHSRRPFRPDGAPEQVQRRAGRARRLGAVALLVFGGTGCVTIKEPGFGPQIEAGVLVTEDGDQYITVRPCMSWKVTAMELRFRPSANSKPQATRQEQVAMRYEFDPPADAARAFGPLDPDQHVEGAELVAFDQELYDKAMATKAGSFVDVPTDPMVVVVVEYRRSDGEDRDIGGLWFADQDEPTTWYAPGYGDLGSANFTCDNDMGWDFSMLPSP